MTFQSVICNMQGTFVMCSPVTSHGIIPSSVAQLIVTHVVYNMRMYDYACTMILKIPCEQ